MVEDETPTLVPGEAPESDEEDVFDKLKFSHINAAKTIQSSIAKIAIVGEALESDEEIEIHNLDLRNSQLEYPDNSEKKLKTEEKIQYKNKINPATLKKLSQKNKSLYNNLISFKKQILSSTNYELNNINQQLLKSQIELQQTLTDARCIKSQLNVLNKKLNNVIVAKYIPKINIKVPSQVI